MQTTPMQYRFEWDSEKEKTNVQKHDGITFQLASSVLHDALALTVYDDEHSDFEERWVTLGVANNGKTLVVVHTYLQIDALHVGVRIISARKADKQERQDYELTPR